MVAPGSLVSFHTPLTVVLISTDNGNVEITLDKPSSGPTWWACAIKGHPKIDVERIEASKHLDDSLLQKLAVSSSNDVIQAPSLILC